MAMGMGVFSIEKYPLFKLLKVRFLHPSAGDDFCKLPFYKSWNFSLNVMIFN